MLDRLALEAPIVPRKALSILYNPVFVTPILYHLPVFSTDDDASVVFAAAFDFNCTAVSSNEIVKPLTWFICPFCAPAANAGTRTTRNGFLRSTPTDN